MKNTHKEIEHTRMNSVIDTPAGEPLSRRQNTPSEHTFAGGNHCHLKRINATETQVTTTHRSASAGGDKASLNSAYYTVQIQGVELGLSICDPTQALSALSPLRSLLELSRVERIVQKIENWLGISLDLQPTGYKPEAPLVLELSSTERRSTRIVGVHLPVEYWTHCVGPIDDLQDDQLALRWPDYFAKLLLGRFSLAEEETAILQKGATVLLPQSFEGNWAPELIVPAANACLSGKIQLPHIEWQAETEYSSMDTSGSHKHLLGDVGEEVICFCSVSASMFFRDDHAALVKMVNNNLTTYGGVMRFGNSQKAGGILIPIGQGMGFHINSLSSSVR